MLDASLVDIDIPDMSAWNAAGTMIISAEAAAVHANWLRTRAHDYSPQVRMRLEQGLAFPAAAYLNALRLRAVALREFNRQVFAKVDLVHAPVVSFQTTTIAETDLGDRPPAAAMRGTTTRPTAPGHS